MYVDLLKKPTLYSNILQNFRPITNLPFLSKVLEKVVAKQLTSHMMNHGLHDDMQSAYRPGASTETALLKVKDDIQRGFDRGEGAFLLVMLDIAAAFDTLDHHILLDRLASEVGTGRLWKCNGFPIVTFVDFLKRETT